MQLATILKWTGRAFPTATAEEKILCSDNSLSRGHQRYARALKTTGNGREKKVTGASGIWRNFASIRQDDETQVMEFVRRWGDPFGELAPGKPSHSDGWDVIALHLGQVAGFWSDADENGVSHFHNRDVSHRVTIMQDIRRSRPFAGDIGMAVEVSDQGKISINAVARSLAGFMLASALAHLDTGQNMRQCEFCADWFAIGRRDSRFCSPSCRAMHATKTKGH
ncbi:hypothetical protein ACIQUG_03520 [Ensifer sp. NPDC090286]|uniref:hypothetical protein n=1 Tax=Ensifer sp. NPDC090286 TaxID=3363991 RepID=UPI00383BDC68